MLRRLTVSPSENVEAGTVQPVVLVETTLPASAATSVAADPVTDLKGMSLNAPLLSAKLVAVTIPAIDAAAPTMLVTSVSYTHLTLPTKA